MSSGSFVRMNKPTYNILILGGTGTGKTTWINSMANYLLHEKFVDALKHHPKCLVPACFLLGDVNGGTHKIQCGIDSTNENTVGAASSTQRPRVYAFTHAECTFNFIDVPGIGDTRGVEKDEENVKAILDAVAVYSELHAICILMKATEARLTVEFRYCLNELLMHLHKKALNNIFFFFTHSRGANYTPGDAYTPLQEYLEELEQEEQIKVELTPENCYSIDNESFRFLCAYHQKPEFRQMNSEPYHQSWKKSQANTMRFLKTISERIPHNVSDTLSMNQARAIIIAMIPCLASVSGIIQMNVGHYEANIDRIVRELQENLVVHDFDIQLTELKRPRTVCTATKCIGTEKSDDLTVTYYRQICHAECYLKNVPLKKQPEPKLRHCAAMSGKETCQWCQCSHELHMHIDVDQRVVTHPSRLQQELTSLSGNTERTNRRSEVTRFVQELEKEQKAITDAMLQFASYLQQNAIFEYNGAYEEYLRMQIRSQEAAVGVGGNPEPVRRLRKLLTEYHEQIKQFVNIINNASVFKVTANDVAALRDQLFNLRLYGEKIHELFKKSSAGNLNRNNINHTVEHQIRLNPFTA